MWGLPIRLQALLIHLSIFVPAGENYRYGFGFEDAMFCYRVWNSLHEFVLSYLIAFQNSTLPGGDNDFMKISDADTRGYLLQNDWVKKEKNPGGILYTPTKKMLNLWVFMSDFIKTKEIYA